MKKVIILGISALCLGVIACSSSKAESNSESVISPFFSSDNVIEANKNYVSKNISLENFNAIENMGSFNVEYRYGNRPHAELYISDNVLPYISLKVKDKQLKISTKGNISIRWKNNKSKIVVYSPSINDMSVIGSGILTVNGPLTGDNYKLQLSGSGNIDVRSIKGSRLTVNLAGSGDINILSLETTQANTSTKLNLAGSGSVNINVLKTKSLAASVAGSGDMNIADISAKSVSASIAGSGDIKLKGTTSIASYAINGSGEIEAGQLKAENVIASTIGSGEITCYGTGKTTFKAAHKSSIRNIAH